MPSLADIDAFVELVRQLADRAGVAIAALDTADLMDAYPQIMDQFDAAAALVAAQWYEDLNPGSSYPVITPKPIPAEALRSNVAWALTRPNPLAELMTAAERHVFNAVRQTVEINANEEGVGFARHASANACAFCRMLATRASIDGTTYTSKLAAERVVSGRGKRALGEKYHDNCHCVAVPVRHGDTYEPAPYVQDWVKEYKDAAESESGTTAVLNRMRREDYDRTKDAVNSRRRQRYAQTRQEREQAAIDEIVSAVPGARKLFDSSPADYRPS